MALHSQLSPPQSYTIEPDFLRFMVSWGLDQKDFNEDARKKLDKIFDEMKEINQRNDFQQQTQSVQSVFTTLGALGGQYNKRSLMKVAEAGNALVGLSMSVAGIKQLSATLPAITTFLQPLAVLNPVLMGLNCVSVLASLCGLGKRRRSKGMDLSPIMQGMQVVLKAVTEAHKAVIEVHHAVHDVHQEVIYVRQDISKVYALVAKLGDYLIQDVKAPLMDMISSVEDSLHRLHVISGTEHREIFLQELGKLTNRMAEHTDGISPLKVENINLLLTDLHGWFGPEKSCSALLTGRNLAQTGVQGHEARWNKQVLSNPNNDMNNLVGFLAVKAEQFTRKNFLIFISTH